MTKIGKKERSSNANEVIRAVLNSLSFFLQTDFAHKKKTKICEKPKPANKAHKNF